LNQYGGSKVNIDDLLKGILIRLRTRPARTAFTWVKGHEENYGNNRADELANTGRITDSQTRMDEDIWIENHPALREITSTRNQTNIQRTS